MEVSCDAQQAAAGVLLRLPCPTVCKLPARHTVEPCTVVSCGMLTVTMAATPATATPYLQAAVDD